VAGLIAAAPDDGKRRPAPPHAAVWLANSALTNLGRIRQPYGDFTKLNRFWPRDPAPVQAPSPSLVITGQRRSTPRPSSDDRRAFETGDDHVAQTHPWIHCSRLARSHRTGSDQRIGLGRTFPRRLASGLRLPPGLGRTSLRRRAGLRRRQFLRGPPLGADAVWSAAAPRQPLLLIG